MYVCVCHGITESQIMESASQGARHVRDLHRHLSLGSQCGKCVCSARELLQAQQNFDLSLAVKAG